MRIMRVVSRSLLALVIMAAVADGFKLSLPSFATGWLARFTRSDDTGALQSNDDKTTTPRYSDALPVPIPKAGSAKRSVRLMREVGRILGGRPLPVSISKIRSVRGLENGGRKRIKRAGKPHGAMVPPPDINGASSQRNGDGNGRNGNGNGNGNLPGVRGNPNIFRAKRDGHTILQNKEKKKALALFNALYPLGLYGVQNTYTNTTTTSTTTLAPA